MWAVILVVDDEPPVCRLIERVLQTAGHCVYTAHNKEEAIEYATLLGTDLDVLVCDIFLPGTSGIDVANTVLALCPQTVVVFISGEFLADDDHSPLKLGNEHYLVLAKPFSREQLRKVITSAINQSKGTKDPANPT